MATKINFSIEQFHKLTTIETIHFKNVLLKIHMFSFVKTHGHSISIEYKKGKAAVSPLPLLNNLISNHSYFNYDDKLLTHLSCLHKIADQHCTPSLQQNFKLLHNSIFYIFYINVLKVLRITTFQQLQHTFKLTSVAQECFFIQARPAPA